MKLGFILFLSVSTLVFWVCCSAFVYRQFKGLFRVNATRREVIAFRAMTALGPLTLLVCIGLSGLIAFVKLLNEIFPSKEKTSWF